MRWDKTASINPTNLKFTIYYVLCIYYKDVTTMLIWKKFELLHLKTQIERWTIWTSVRQVRALVRSEASVQTQWERQCGWGNAFLMWELHQRNEEKLWHLSELVVRRSTRLQRKHTDANLSEPPVYWRWSLRSCVKKSFKSFSV